MDWTQIVVTLISALGGGGLVAMIMLPEQKKSAKLDNAERIIEQWQKVVEKYEHRISELEVQVKELEEKNEQKDARIDELEHQIIELQLNTVQRGKNGRFVKKQK